MVGKGKMVPNTRSINKKRCKGLNLKKLAQVGPISYENIIFFFFLGKYVEERER